jgi:hypothetical protein
MDLVRQILLYLEQSDVRPGHIEIPGRSQKQLVYHIELLNDAGLLVANVSHYSSGQSDADVQHMTWTGHELLDLARDEKQWKSVTSVLMKKTDGLAFDILRAALIEQGRRAAGLEPGHRARGHRSRPQATGLSSSRSQGSTRSTSPLGP